MPKHKGKHLKSWKLGVHKDGGKLAKAKRKGKRGAKA
jgi:hypothetical protein